MAMCFSSKPAMALGEALYFLSSRGEKAPWWWDLEAKKQEGAGGKLRGQGTQSGVDD